MDWLTDEWKHKTPTEEIDDVFYDDFRYRWLTIEHQSRDMNDDNMTTALTNVNEWKR